MNRVAALYRKTQKHREDHQCGAYAYADAQGLEKLMNQEKPMLVLELGTALGYTACLMALASPSSFIQSIESHKGHIALARQNVKELGLETRIRIIEGSFEPVLENLKDKYNFIFFDGFNPTPQIVSLLITKLQNEGILVMANMNLITKEEQKEILSLIPSLYWQELPPLEEGRTKVYRKLF